MAMAEHDPSGRTEAPSPGAWLEGAAGFSPSADWLGAGPRLFSPPGARPAWAAAVRGALQTHPRLARQLRGHAVPHAVSASQSGFVEPGQWTSCLPAAALLALADGSPEPLDAVRDRIPRVLAIDDWVPPHHAHSRPLDLSAAGVVEDLALYLDIARDFLPGNERALVAGAIASRGVLPLVEMCRARAAWTTSRSNWPTVIAGQVGLGLLAAWECVEAVGIRPHDALVHVVERIAAPLLTYPEDGSYEEGPGYWDYGIGACLPFCDALWIATEGQVDLFTLPNLARTGDYGLHVRTPDGGCFDVEDGVSRWIGGWMLGVLGRRTGRPDLAAAGVDTLGSPAGGPVLRQITLLAPRTAPATPTPAPVPMAFFPGTQNAMLRSDWSSDAFFAGLHAGSNTVDHAHLDLGTFTVLARGERILQDVGSWEYTLDYFRTGPGEARWDYEPNTTAGHNALLVDGSGQDPLPSAMCRFHQVDLHPESGLALLSVRLTAAYGGRLREYVRHFAFFAEGLLLVVDAVEAEEPRRLSWCAHPTGVPEPLSPGNGMSGPLGWRWRIGGASAELRVLGLEERNGFVLSEARRHTRYVDRGGRGRNYATESVRVDTLHPVTSWHIIAALRAGPADALPEAVVELTGDGVAVATGARCGTLAWSGGSLAWWAARP